MGLFKIDVYLNALGKKDQVSFSLDDLKRYDPSLLSLIQEIFPCDNAFISKCKSSRGKHLNLLSRIINNLINIKIKYAKKNI